MTTSATSMTTSPAFPASSSGSSGSSGTATSSAPYGSPTTSQSDLEPPDAGPEHARLHKAVREFGGYIARQRRVHPQLRRALPGRRGHLHFASPSPRSTRSISKRMVKKQQMRWTPRGAHLLLQVRTRVLNDDLADDFHRWHPGFTHTAPEPEELAAAA